MTRPGIFITFEAPEDCGKTSPIERLTRALQATGTDQFFLFDQEVIDGISAAARA